MAKYLNCPNCGAGIEGDKDKCPYCGTSYFDICGLQCDGTPFILKFMTTDYKGTPITLTAKVMATSQMISAAIHSNPELELHFVVLPDYEGKTFSVVSED